MDENEEKVCTTKKNNFEIWLKKLIEVKGLFGSDGEIGNKNKFPRCDLQAISPSCKQNE